MMDAPAVQVLSIDVIVSDPKIRRGRPVIKGTGIRVMDLVGYHTGEDKMKASELAEAYALDIGLIHAALAYYYLHQDEIDADIQADLERGEQLFSELEAQGKARRIPIHPNDLVQE
jgi:uncharacterized protein (DUF433 family)